MKYIFLIISCFVFLLNFHAQNLKNTIPNQKLTKHEKFYSNGQKMIEYFSDSDNLKDSLETTWYSHGKLKSKIYYKQNNTNGQAKEWYSNGELKFEGIYSTNFQKEGQCSRYYENGQLEYSAFFYKGYAIGQFVSYYLDGKKKNEYHQKIVTNEVYIKKHHTQIIINKRDTITLKNTGYVTSWFSNGIKNERKYYTAKGIQKYNRYKSWYENGQLKRKGSFKQKNGKHKEWYNNGQLKFSIKNKKNLVYKSKYWHKNGQIAEIQKYNNAKLINSYQWDKHGNLRREYQVFDDYTTEKKWDKNANLILIIKWDKNGNIIE